MLPIRYIIIYMINLKYWRYSYDFEKIKIFNYLIFKYLQSFIPKH